MASTSTDTRSQHGGWDDPTAANVHTGSVNPRIAVPPGEVRGIPQGVLDVVYAASPGRAQPSGAPVSVTSLTPATGVAAGGTTVTFTGKGFQGDVLSVTFGGVAATQVTVVSDTSFTARSPAHAAGAAAVVVNGTTVPGGFTYT